MRTIIAGSRGITSYKLLLEAINNAPFTPTLILSGGARGADKLGELYAFQQGLPLEKFPADWTQHGKNAGYIRNIAMAKKAGLITHIQEPK